MPFNFKSRIKNFIDQKIRELKKHQSQTQQTALDYAQISRLFPESNFIPFTTWSISPSVILHILNDITINKRRNIIEFGSGASTLYIAKLIQTLKLEVNFFSVESNKEWLDKMSGELALNNLEGIVNLIHAPIIEVKKELCLHEQKLWYDNEGILSGIGNIQQFDLVIVDGPYGGSTPYARYSAIPFLKSRLSNNYSVFLDDTQREHEDEIARQWSQILNLEPQRFHRYVYFTSNTTFGTSPFKLAKS